VATESASSFAVTAAAQHVELDAFGVGQALFTVTNTKAHPLQGRLLPRPDDPASAEWLSIVGASVRDFAPNATEQVVVHIDVPHGSPPGSYSFRLAAASETNPDDDYAESSAVGIDVPQPTRRRERPSWWILVAAVLIVGAIVWLIAR
jgi:hypothetical protein